LQQHAQAARGGCVLLLLQRVSAAKINTNAASDRYINTLLSLLLPFHY
jgi:hypothetical protein